MKPNAILPMVIWCLLTAATLGGIMALSLLMIAIDPALTIVQRLTNGGTWLLLMTGLSVGAAAGLLIGILNGMLMQIIVGLMPPYRTPAQQRQRTAQALPVLALLMTLASSLVLYGFDQLLMIGDQWWLWLALLMGLSALYPVTRYMTRLRRWYMIQPRQQHKPASYNHTRLTDSRPADDESDATLITSQSLSKDSFS